MVASRAALDAAGIGAHQLDCIVFGTQTSDYYSPASGCVLAAKLGLVGIPAFDVHSQCAGFLYALAIADHFVRLGTYARVLVVAAEVMSSYIEKSSGERDASMVFGDGAGAVIVVAEPNGRRGILATGLHSDGRFARSAMIEVPGSAGGPLTVEDIQNGRHLAVFDRKRLRVEGRRRLSESLREAFASCGLSVRDVAHFFFNAGSTPIATRICHRWGVPADRVHSDLAEHGNTRAASLPICLDEMVRRGRIAPEDIVVLASFGSGLTWAWAVIRW